MAIAKTTPLLEVLNQRWQDVIQHIPDVTTDKPAARPIFHVDGLKAARQAALLHAEANNSDPFAGRRAYHYIRQGYWSASEVRADALRETQARRSAGATFPTVKLEGSL